MKFFKNTKKNKGFTLVEMLVAVSIFSMAVVSLMVIIGGGISDIEYAKTRITASYLAQEGVEYMRNMADTYMLYTPENAGWTAFLEKISVCNSQSGGDGCYFNDSGVYNGARMPVTQIEVSKCTLSCPELFYDESTGQYNYNISGIPTGIKRKINIEYPANPDREIKVISTVTWTQKSGEYSISFSEELFKWIE